MLHALLARGDQGARDHGAGVAAPPQRGRRPDAADLHDLRQHCVERRVRHRRHPVEQQPTRAPLLEQQRIRPARGLERGSVGGAQRFDREVDAPPHHQVELRRLGMPAADLPRRERRRHDELPQAERVEVLAAVFPRASVLEPQRLTRGHDLVPRAREAGDRAAGASAGLAGQDRHVRHRSGLPVFLSRVFCLNFPPPHAPLHCCGRAHARLRRLRAHGPVRSSGHGVGSAVRRGVAATRHLEPRRRSRARLAPRRVRVLVLLRARRSGRPRSLSRAAAAGRRPDRAHAVRPHSRGGRLDRCLDGARHRCGGADRLRGDKLADRRGRPAGRRAGARDTAGAYGGSRRRDAAVSRLGPGLPSGGAAALARFRRPGVRRATGGLRRPVSGLRARHRADRRGARHARPARGRAVAGGAARHPECVLARDRGEPRCDLLHAGRRLARVPARALLGRRFRGSRLRSRRDRAGRPGCRAPARGRGRGQRAVRVRLRPRLRGAAGRRWHAASRGPLLRRRFHGVRRRAAVPSACAVSLGDAARGRSRDGPERGPVGVRPAVTRRALLPPLLVLGAARLAAQTGGAVAVPPVPVQARPGVVLDPLATATTQRISGAELRRLPVSSVDEGIALSAGSVGASYRGGRLGEQAFILDGLGMKNQLDASTGPLGGRLPPDILEEATLLTNGFSARYGHALSGLINVVTKDGGDRWRGRAAYETDRPAPDGWDYGLDRAGAEADGPLGRGIRLLAVLDATGRLDAAPVNAPAPLDARDPRRARPWLLPHNSGETYDAAGKLTVPIGSRETLRFFALRSLEQRLLYDPAFKYDDQFAPGVRVAGTLASAHWQHVAGPRAARPLLLDLRAGYFAREFLRGTLADPVQYRFGAFTGRSVHIAGESIAPARDTVAAPAPIPGLAPPDLAAHTPWGVPAFFLSDGSRGEVAWNRFRDLRAQLDADIGLGPSADLYFGGAVVDQRVQTFERVLGFLPVGDTVPPAVASDFSPRSAAAYTESQLRWSDLGVTLGLRYDQFDRSEEHTSELQSPCNLVCRLLLEK